MGQSQEFAQPTIVPRYPTSHPHGGPRRRRRPAARGAARHRAHRRWRVGRLRHFDISRGDGGLWRKILIRDDRDARRRSPMTPSSSGNGHDWRRGMILEAHPNPAHEVLARWTQRRPHAGHVARQGDDSRARGPSIRHHPERWTGSHERRGRLTRLIRLHGSIWHVRCCSAVRDFAGFDSLDTSVPQPRLPPTCPHCGSIVRPAVVWFGEPLDPQVFERANHVAAAAYRNLPRHRAHRRSVSSGDGLVHLARRTCAFTVELNTMTTAASKAVDATILAPAAETLQRIDAALRT